MMEASVGVDQTADPIGEYILLLGLKSSDCELRSLLLAVLDKV